MINDHTTGLCKVSSLMFRLFQYLPQQMCESIRINYEKYVKEMKKLCRCRTKNVITGNVPAQVNE